MKVNVNKVLNVVRMIVRVVVCILGHKDRVNKHRYGDDQGSRADQQQAQDDNQPSDANDSNDNSESCDRQ